MTHAWAGIGILVAGILLGAGTYHLYVWYVPHVYRLKDGTTITMTGPAAVTLPLEISEAK